MASRQSDASSSSSAASFGLAVPCSKAGKRAARLCSRSDCLYAHCQEACQPKLERPAQFRRRFRKTTKIAQQDAETTVRAGQIFPG